VDKAEVAVEAAKDGQADEDQGGQGAGDGDDGVDGDSGRHGA
jgi:hypothetical protein